MIKDLIKLSNHLDAKGLRKEADYLDAAIRRVADLTEPTKPARSAVELHPDLSDLKGKLIEMGYTVSKQGPGGVLSAYKDYDLTSSGGKKDTLHITLTSEQWLTGPSQEGAG